MRLLAVLAVSCSPAMAPAGTDVTLHDAGTCHSVRVAPRRAVTAAHCTRSPERDELADVAWVDVATGPYLEIRSPPRIGERVTACGQRGTIERVSLAWRSALVSVRAERGDSGSAVLGSDGALVCVVTAYRVPDHAALCGLLLETP
ncbi:MAG: hypothetical protein A2Y78_00145 [Acidobacteria bacterium RBG_13_68_16]|nr:MAG: hypothetical protein A2Y78_00145 [Acidobacteria bacterium RBG_13_68_16]